MKIQPLSTQILLPDFVARATFLATTHGLKEVCSNRPEKPVRNVFRQQRGFWSRYFHPVRTAEGAAKPAVTFNKNITPLVFKNCTSCHRPGEVAPFPLQDYRDVARKAELTRRVTAGRVIAPRKAEPGSGHFADERRLGDDEIALINRWVEAGT